MANVARSTIIRYACLIRRKTRRSGKEYGIPRRYLGTIMSPGLRNVCTIWRGHYKIPRRQSLAVILEQIAIAKTEPGDEKQRDISALVGKVDIRKLEHHAQNDPDAYGYSGALCRSNQGIMEFVEMFKAPIKVLHPLLTATRGRKLQRDRRYLCPAV